MNLMRTHGISQLTIAQVGERVILSGWIARIRAHKSIVFLDLRDRDELLQVVVESSNDHAFQLAQTLGREDVISVEGQILERQPGTYNPSIRTGSFELSAERIEVLNQAKEPVFPLDSVESTDERVRIQYRYLDLRSQRMQRNLRFRARMIQFMRRYLESQRFIEVETPILANSTPEGARDFLVPSRVHPGRFYALPQSPQQFKQLLMVGGIDRYYQIARCFRDEDSRGDRQPEFTQLDVEMAFVQQEQVITLISGLITELFDELGVGTITAPIARITYGEAMRRFGTDRPDTRFGMEFQDLDPAIVDPAILPIAGQDGRIVAMRIPFGCDLPRETLQAIVNSYTNGGIHATLLPEHPKKPWHTQVLNMTQAVRGETVIVGAGSQWAPMSKTMSELRLRLGDCLHLRQPRNFDLLWVTDFPLLEWNAEEDRWDAVHHPFTAPSDEDLHLLASNPGRVRAKAYDIVMQGVEIGGGSIRIHRRDIQEQVFALLGIDRMTAWKRFGHLLNAFNFGTPPHGGIALGLDRIAMLLLGEPSIREVLAFPKTSSGVDLMTGAPSVVDERQLKEANIKLR